MSVGAVRWEATRYQWELLGGGLLGGRGRREGAGELGRWEGLLGISGSC